MTVLWVRLTATLVLSQNYFCRFIFHSRSQRRNLESWIKIQYLQSRHKNLSIMQNQPRVTANGRHYADDKQYENIRGCVGWSSRNIQRTYAAFRIKCKECVKVYFRNF